MKEVSQGIRDFYSEDRTYFLHRQSALVESIKFSVFKAEQYPRQDVKADPTRFHTVNLLHS